jgi:mannitol/fructose-specific phosphotransferase system IIA component (Ntr-type)
MLVGPEKPASLHIKMLSRISRLCNQPAFRKKIIDSTSSIDILRIIQEEEKLIEI